jgi:hypothetical protein
VFHYTTRAGYNAIQAGVAWVFEASAPPKRDPSHPTAAYFTTLHPGAPNLNRLHIPKRKREFVFAFRDAGDLTPLRGGRGGFILYSVSDYVVHQGRQVDCGESGVVLARLRASHEV